jgi:hypothetical protein
MEQGARPIPFSFELSALSFELPSLTDSVSPKAVEIKEDL